MKTKKILLFLCILCVILQCGCNSKSKKSKNTENVQSEAFIPQEITIDGVDTSYIASISMSTDEKTLYLSVTNYDSTTMPDQYSMTFDGKTFLFLEENFDSTTMPDQLCKFFKLTKDGDSYTNPVEIKLPDDKFVTSAFIGRDDKTVYLSSIEKNEVDPTEISMINNFYTVSGQKIAKGTLNQDSVTDVEYIDELNTSLYQLPVSEDSDGNLLYIVGDEDLTNNTLCIAKNNSGTYTSEKFNNRINAEYRPTISAAISPDSNEIVYTQYGDDSIYTGLNLHITYNQSNNWSTPETIRGEINASDTDMGSSYFSTNGDNFYFISFNYENGYDSCNAHFYRGTTKSLLANNNTFSATTNEEYATNNFEECTRDKGDMSAKEGIYYELFVFSFADSNGDGVGDLNGITSKLDYLHDLGIDGLWLTPIFCSDSYHGYDVTDYDNINPLFGSNEDFQTLLDEAHSRGMKIIVDFPINHTSSTHPWFVEATTNPDSKYVDYYNFVSKDDTSKYSLSDQSPWGSDCWHQFGDCFYYGIFSSDMPDLNYNNPEVRTEVTNSALRWVKMGVDGFRIDAAMHIYESNEFKEINDSTSDTIQWWNEFATSLEEVNPNIYLVGEVWNDGDVLAEYVQPFDTKFDFSTDYALLECLKNDTALLSTGNTLGQEIADLYKAYDDVDTNYLNGPFLSNHDQDRIMSSLGSAEKAKLAANIYLTLPGNPYLYYGEELGMVGSGDNDAYKRTNFKWTNDSQVLGNAYQIDLGNNTKTPSLEEQINDSNSMYNHYKKIISIRKNTPALTSGKYTVLNVENQEILAYIRGEGTDSVYVIHNLSSSPISVDIDGISGSEVIYNSNDSTTIQDSTLTIEAYSTIIVKPN